MARDRRGRIVYNNDATVIEETPNVEVKQRPDVVAPRRATARNVEIHIEDVVDALASYTPFNVEKGSGDGKCLICNTKTQYPIRKICVNCMKRFSDQIHQNAVDAVERGDMSITLNTVE